MTEAEKLARFVCTKTFLDLSDKSVEQLKIRILDALGCAFGALNSSIAQKLRLHLEDIGGNQSSSLIGGKKSSLEQSTFFNSALVRYLDYNDSYMAKGETCHPSDNLSAIFAAAEIKNLSGKDFLVALAITYQVHCRLSDEAPVRAKGFDHTTQGAYAVAAGIAKALELDQQQTSHAIAISGASNLALRVTRTGKLSHWKGLAYAQTAFIAMHSTLLAQKGITGPLEVFEGNKGFKELSGDFTIDWQHEDLEKVKRTIIKKYNAEIHSQSSIEGVLELKNQSKFCGDDIDKIEIEIFDVAYNIIGGGEEGDKISINTKEEADHSLRYIVAVALLDGDVQPQQYESSRIQKNDVQNLMKKIIIKPNKTFSQQFPQKMWSSINITLKTGQKLSVQKHDYEGFHTRPFSFSNATKKFFKLTDQFLSKEHQEKIIDTVANLESKKICDLSKLFSCSHQGVTT